MQDEQASQPRPATGGISGPGGQQHPAAVAAGTQDRPATAEPRVDEALTGLDQLAGLPVTEHPAVFERVHRQLREVLGELDAGPPG